VNRNLQSHHRHAAADRLRPYSLIAARWKVLDCGPSLAFSCTLFKKWADAGFDLPLLKRPTIGLPFFDEVAPALDSKSTTCFFHAEGVYL
jgi:hypothetical protein